MKLDRDMMTKAISRVMAIAEDAKTSAVKLLFTSGEMQIEWVTSNGQTAVEALHIDYEGGDCYRGFNGALVKDTLESITSQSFLLFGNDPEAPGHFVQTNDADEDRILMAMRVKA